LTKEHISLLTFTSFRRGHWWGRQGQGHCQASKGENSEQQNCESQHGQTEWTEIKRIQCTFRVRYYVSF